MTLTTEQLRARIAHYRELAYRYGMSGNPKHEAQYRDDAAFLEELLANREAQPVLYASEETLAYAKEGEKSLVTWSEPMGDAVIPLYTSPPAPSVPDDYQHLKNVRELYHKQEERLFALAQRINGASFDKYSHTTAQAIDVLENAIFGDDGNACRAAMPAQPVSGGYKFVPVEPTEDMIAAAMNCDDVSFNADETFCVNFGNIYAAMLAAAPEGGNDHDTGR
ncbi:hypothetical protein ACTVM0_16465 [Serratia marcescens]|uniref:hypothetical protein n=1 Tax=Serratia marcescens TaxID=615 RepID=UPI003FA7B246